MDCYLVQHSKKGIAKGSTRDSLTTRVWTKAIGIVERTNTVKAQQVSKTLESFSSVLIPYL
jgi:hypothetical protein